MSSNPSATPVVPASSAASSSNTDVTPAASSTTAPATVSTDATDPTPSPSPAPAAAPVDRLAEVSRILSAQPLNPFDVLAVRTDASVAEVRKQHRLLSMKIHPDRFTDQDSIARAQRAFALVTAAKNDLLNESKRAEYASAVLIARESVIAEQNKAECARRGYPLPPSADAAAVSTIIAARLAQPGTPPFPQWPQHAQWHDWVRSALSIALEEADLQRQRAARAAALDEVGAAAERVKRRADAADEAERNKEWELHRDERVAAWRRFSAAAAITTGASSSAATSSGAAGGKDEEEWGLLPPVTPSAPAVATVAVPATDDAPVAAPSASVANSTAASAAAHTPAASAAAAASGAGAMRRFFRPPAARGEKARGGAGHSASSTFGSGSGVTTRDIDEWG